MINHRILEGTETAQLCFPTTVPSHWSRFFRDMTFFFSAGRSIDSQHVFELFQYPQGLNRTTLHASAKEWKLPSHYTYSQEGNNTFKQGKQEKETFFPQFITSLSLFSIHPRQCVFKCSSRVQRLKRGKVKNKGGGLTMKVTYLQNVVKERQYNFMEAETETCFYLA